MAFDEGQHPRDERGRFAASASTKANEASAHAERAGTAKAHQAAAKAHDEANTAHQAAKNFSIARQHLSAYERHAIAARRLGADKQKAQVMAAKKMHTERGIDVTDYTAALKDVKKAGLTAKKSKEWGIGGGNPSLDIKGPKEKVKKLLSKWGY